MLFSLAWRNIWRLPRRSLIILAAVISGVWAVLAMNGFMNGMMEQMIQNGITTLTGHIKIASPGYHDDPVVAKSLSETQNLSQALAQLNSQAKWAKRVRVPAIANNARNSSGVMLVGINPEQEKGVSFIPDSIKEGRYLKPAEPYGILIGRKLAEKFETKLGNKIVLMSENTEGEIASAGFEIVGIFETELEATEKAYVFISAKAAQELLKLGNRFSEVSIMLPDREQIPAVQSQLKAELSGDVEILNWEEVLPLVKSYISIWTGFSLIWIAVIFIAVGLGLVNTMLMAVLERVREFGILKAIGMKPVSIIKMIVIETATLVVLGTLLGDALGYVSADYFFHKGIDLSVWAEGVDKFGMSRIVYPFLTDKDFWLSNSFIIIFGTLICLYPAVKGARIEPVEALTHV